MCADRMAGAEDLCTNRQWLGPGCGREAVVSEDEVAGRAWRSGSRNFDFVFIISKFY